MECNICCEAYDLELRVPKTVVPCGHPVCLPCLQRSGRQQCPSCRQPFAVRPASLPNNFSVMDLIENQGKARTPRRWCSECRATAKPQCLDEHAHVRPEAALRRQLQGLEGALPLLPAGQDDCDEEQALQALTLLAGEPWDLTLQNGDRVLTGTVQNAGNPTARALCLQLATTAGLVEVGVEGNEPRGAPPAGPRRPRAAVLELDLELASKHGSINVLAGCRGVVRLANLSVRHENINWSLAVLMRAAPTLEQLDLLNPRDNHLIALADMPRLTRLRIDNASAHLTVEMLTVPSTYSGLRWLHASRVPRLTLESLLKAHGRTLETLYLVVGTASRGDIGWQREYKEWYRSCGDLHLLLARAELRALRRLVLQRQGIGNMCPLRVSTDHDQVDCTEQCEAVRRVLPRVQVQCQTCAIGEGEAF